jgi:hypothetical protein
MGPRCVEIVVNGDVDDRLETEFGRRRVTVTGGVTHVRVVTRDASALHGVLVRLEALGFELLAVRRRGRSVGPRGGPTTR